MLLCYNKYSLNSSTFRLLPDIRIMAGSRNFTKARARLRTAKVIDRLTYSPKKHKRKEMRKRIEALQAQKPLSQKAAEPNPTIKFGSFNINGLDLETGWAVEQLLISRGFDVSNIPHIVFDHIKDLYFETINFNKLFPATLLLISNV